MKLNGYQLISESIQSKIPTFDDPKSLLKWMSDNVQYGWMDKNYTPYKVYGKFWWKHYRMLLPEEVYKYKRGTCWDQTIFEDYVFKRDFPKLESKIFFIAQFINEKESNTHTMLVYKRDNKWYWFENSYFKHRGIHGPYSSPEQIVKTVFNKMKEDNPGDRLWFKEMDSKKFKKRLSGIQFMDAADYPWPDDKSNIENELIKSEKNGYIRYHVEYLKKHYPYLLKDPVHMWRATTGIELIHKEPTRDEQIRIWKNWNLMTDPLKRISDKQCLKFFHKTNKEMNEFCLQRNIVVTGLSGSGKTTLAKQLSDKLHLEYISLDTEIRTEIGNKYSKEEWKKLPKETSYKIYREVATKIGKHSLKLLSNKNAILEGTCFIYPEMYKDLIQFIDKDESNKIILLDPPIDIVIKRRTKREIEKKESELGHSLTNDEKKKKLENSKQLTKELYKFVISFKKTLGNKITVVKD